VTAQESTESTFTHTFYEAGTYTIEFGDRSEMVYVDGDDLLLPSITITSPDDGFVFNSPTETIRWSAEQGQYPISHFEIRIDEDTWKHTGTVNHHTVTDLDEGDHSFSVKVVDSEGNEVIASIDFSVEIEEDESTETTMPMWAMASIIALTVALVVGLVILILLLRKGKEDKQQEGFYQEEKEVYQDEGVQEEEVYQEEVNQEEGDEVYQQEGVQQEEEVYKEEVNQEEDSNN